MPPAAHSAVHVLSMRPADRCSGCATAHSPPTAPSPPAPGHQAGLLVPHLPPWPRPAPDRARRPRTAPPAMARRGVLQLQRLTLTLCDHSGSSRGARRGRWAERRRADGSGRQRRGVAAVAGERPASLLHQLSPPQPPFPPPIARHTTPPENSRTACCPRFASATPRWRWRPCCAAGGTPFGRRNIVRHLLVGLGGWRGVGVCGRWAPRQHETVRSVNPTHHPANVATRPCPATNPTPPVVNGNTQAAPLRNASAREVGAAAEALASSVGRKASVPVPRRRHVPAIRQPGSKEAAGVQGGWRPGLARAAVIVGGEVGG